MFVRASRDVLENMCRGLIELLHPKWDGFIFMVLSVGIS
jgi:hypothetical protein